MRFRGIPFFLPAILLFFAAILSQQCTDSSTATLPEKVDFNFHVRPILVKNCYLCHGPDPSSREAELRLDTFEDATAQREDGKFAVAPGHPDESEMIRRILASDPNEVMPPPESNLSLSEQEKALLEKWIEQGAEWKPHWAFIPLEKAAIPEVDTEEEVANEMDAFVLQKLEAENIAPAPLASKQTLIRRLSYLLTGLPPHPDDVQKFLADESPEAYEKLVDQYLNIPHFGERWARHWMDLVRYAETKGHEFDYPVEGAWQYRDYLIRAFNQDIPYPQLVREHLSGDLLAEPRYDPASGRNESVLGTIFYTMSEGKHSPVDLVIDESERVDNIIDVTTKTFQALTVSCARCHDHKFDPIPTTDYYALYGMVKSSRFSIRDAEFGLEEVENLEELSEIRQSLKELLAEEITDQSGLPVQQAAMREAVSETEVGSSYEVLGDFSGSGLDNWQSLGKAFGGSTTLGTPVFNKNATQLMRLSEGKASSRQMNTGVVGALRSPNFTITKDFLGVRALGKNASIRIIIDNFQLIQNPIYGELEMRVDKESWQDYSVDVSPWEGHTAYIEVIPGYFQRHDYQLPEDAYVEVAYALAYEADWPDQPLISNSPANTLPQAVRHWVAGQATAEDIRLINQSIQKKPLRNLSAEIQQLYQQEQQLVRQFRDTAFFAGITEGFGINSPVFLRGNPQNLSEEKVPHRFLSSLSAEGEVFSSPGSGREELAEAILAPDNPLTDRVMVNRLWHHLFGRGIVETVDNFGLQGKLPTHPELLDFLAIKFREEGWSVKRMLKYMLMSRTFQREVITGADLPKNDPENLLLSGFSLRRLEAESIRDAMLATSGSLDSAMYGPSVPVHLTDFMQGRGRPRESGPLDGNGRRSIYVEVRRNFLSPMMLTFDRPIPFSTFGKRNETNVPAQSLFLMNDPFVAQQAEVMAKRVLAQKGLTEEARIQRIYHWAFAREAGPDEVQRAKVFLQQQAETHEVSPDEIMQSVAVWKDYCHTVFNMKEFIYLI